MAEKQDIEQLHPSQRPADITWGNCQRRLRHGLLLTLLAFVGTCLFRSAFSALDPLEQVLSQMPLTDGHNDFPIWIRAFYHNHIYQDNFTDQIRLPREPYNLTSGSEHVYHEIVRDTFQQIDLVRRLTEHFPASLVPASSVAEIRDNFNHHPGRISSLLGIEGLHQIGTSPSILRVYHQLGVRYASLTHTCHNHYADSEAPADAQHHGLSAAGEALVAEMNRLGMIVDLSHTSRETQRAALALSRAPVMYSHSSAYALCPHSRNVDDESLRLLQQNNGIIMITFYPEYTNCEDPEAATLADVADHIQYVGNLIGYRHVGLGSDFDGMARGPKGLEDVSKYPNLVQELLDRGVAVDDVVAVVGGNVLRVLEAVEKVAHTSRHLLSLEDDVKPFFG
ncbi:hypothetical protein CNMCM8980_008020 [Aspergillus fumigatiaffinis]|uniref:Dipeptidase n=1 Tax=Aspergillus fumigatiaffinis TaxID=340414 RepID=A0A8H4HDJ2_9EURO|nr:hypothetical protein CNMCM5878_002608 [Aspergillus fumigatiaffinis]KAF4220165.1 hypothetical protein CNMCM6457_002531 [Aspergillus fumigatiaffinis]KAF4241474.1 hypothetical protein CNMCM6805_004132 [Aspergillus fumigatiaffinis]KAF4246859.1 hypothetical protein CNMCM8980_008020 [Aspergillus fumigatiaffinis]